MEIAGIELARGVQAVVKAINVTAAIAGNFMTCPICYCDSVPSKHFSNPKKDDWGYEEHRWRLIFTNTHSTNHDH